MIVELQVCLPPENSRAAHGPLCAYPPPMMGRGRSSWVPAADAAWVAAGAGGGVVLGHRGGAEAESGQQGGYERGE
ncbi:hypothetical protein IHE61_23930 [Streptomyces sp. GKU 257-1]|nr:hypothetical protein [Streptomyces sp. GKU 257-1]